MKLTTKLLLGVTVVAGLSISAFAACASDVDFGSTDGTNGKKITGLMNGSNPQDAVNYGQLGGTKADLILDTNTTIYNDRTLRVFTVGNIGVITGRVNIPIGSSSGTGIATLPVDKRPAIASNFSAVCLGQPKAEPVWVEIYTTGVVSVFGRPSTGCTDISINGVYALAN